MKIKRGDIFLAELDPTRGYKIQKTRPVLIVTNDIANEFSKLVTVAPLTSKKLDRILNFEVSLGKLRGLNVPSKVLIQQIRTLDKTRLVRKLSHVTPEAVVKIDEALKIHLGLR